jgi:predicted porin
MKKAAALALMAGASVVAHAQSSSSNVTLFGIIDAGVRYTKNGDSNVKSLSSNGLNTSRLGFRGIEDLGGGLKAGFWIETGFKPDTGEQQDSTRLFNRRATVSLIGNFGEVRLGRDYSPTYTGYADFDAFGTNGVAAADKFPSKFGTNVDTLTRADNLASYFLPSNLGGFYGQVSVAAGEGQGGKKYYGGRVGYAAGKLNVSGSYGQTTVTPLIGAEDKVKFGTIGASYDLDVVKLTGYVTQTKYADQKQLIVNVGALIPAGPGTVRVGFVDVNASGTTPAGVSTDNDDARQFALGYVYDLSKRTALYTTVARVNNKNAAAYVVDSNPALPKPNNGQDSTGYEIGIRHSF